MAAFSRRAAARAKLVAGQRFGLDVDPDARIAGLSVGERQRVEILKALYRGARILILDEPTAVLTPQESEALFEHPGADGRAGPVDHLHQPQARRGAARIAPRRRAARRQAGGGPPAAGARQGQLAQWMVGRQVADAHASGRVPARPCASLRDATVQAADGRELLDGVTLALRGGEIVAIAGVSGNGQVALAEVLCGSVRPPAPAGRSGQRCRPAAALVRTGVARIPEDRHAVGVVGDLPVWENAVSERLRRPTSRAARGRARGAQAPARAAVERFDVRGRRGLDTPARSLSGGNMQKLILGRALLHRTPGARPVTPHAHRGPPADLGPGHRRGGLRAAAADRSRGAGAAVLLISDDLDEVVPWATASP